DGERVMWRWRDWVIDAFNDNRPFDRFTIEQIAGDLLPRPTLEEKIATGFNRNHRGNAEGGIIPEEYAVEYVVDRVDTTATVWLGVTLGCARCHSHKYDPFTQKEYYQLFAFFNNVPERGKAIKYGNSPPMIKAPTRAQQEQLRHLDDQFRAAERAWEGLRAETDRAQAEWEKMARGRGGERRGGVFSPPHHPTTSPPRKLDLLEGTPCPLSSRRRHGEYDGPRKTGEGRGRLRLLRPGPSWPGCRLRWQALRERGRRRR